MVRASLAQQFDPKVLAAISGLDLRARYVVEGFLSGRHESPFHGFSVEFSEYRDYQPGDDLRHLDWRLYARSDRLCIKQYKEETNTRFYLVCDTSGSMAYRGKDAWDSKFAAAQTLAAALSWLLLRQNDAVGLIALDEREDAPELIRPSQKPSQFGLLLRHLDQLRPAGGPRLHRLLDHCVRLIHRRSVLVLFSDLLEPADEIALPLKQLRFDGHECIVLQTLDRDETEFPFSRGQVFEDLETHERRVVDPHSVRQRYLGRFRAFMHQHAEQLRALEMHHCQVQTNQPPWSALANFLSDRKRLQ
jgi:uncharacterized protein (DUF58 family)